MHHFNVKNWYIRKELAKDFVYSVGLIKKIIPELQVLRFEGNLAAGANPFTYSMSKWSVIPPIYRLMVKIVLLINRWGAS